MGAKVTEREMIFREIYRILQPGGQLLVWDVVIPNRDHAGMDVSVVPLAMSEPASGDSNGYGMIWIDGERDMSLFVRLADEVGFDVVAQRSLNRGIYLQLRKPQCACTLSEN
jgi:ubiquinone/menaquinone biosynthesis C-methylase UbiE